MIDFRKLLVAIAIAVLFAVFVNTSIEAISPPPQYDKFCNETTVGSVPQKMYTDSTNLTSEEKKAIDDYNANQKKCSDALQVAQEKHNFVVFIVSAITGLIAIIVGLYVPVTSPVGMSIASGFILGGLFTLFFGTINSWGSIQLQVRPFVMLAELAVVILAAYKQLNKPLEDTTAIVAATNAHKAKKRR